MFMNNFASTKQSISKSLMSSISSQAVSHVKIKDAESPDR